MIFFFSLVVAAPELKEAFADVDIEHPEGGKFQAYSLRVLGAFDLVITLLDDLEAVDVATTQMAEVWGARTGFNTKHFQVSLPEYRLNFTWLFIRLLSCLFEKIF